MPCQISPERTVLLSTTSRNPLFLAVSLGETVDEASEDLLAAVEDLLVDREADSSRDRPVDALRLPVRID